MPLLLYTCSQRTKMHYYCTLKSLRMPFLLSIHKFIKPVLLYTCTQNIILPVLLSTRYSGHTHVTKFALSDCPLWWLNMIFLSVQHEVVVLLCGSMCCSVLKIVGDYTLQWWQLCTLYFIMQMVMNLQHVVSNSVHFSLAKFQTFIHVLALIAILEEWGFRICSTQWGRVRTLGAWIWNTLGHSWGITAVGYIVCIQLAGPQWAVACLALCNGVILEGQSFLSVFCNIVVVMVYFPVPHVLHYRQGRISCDIIHNQHSWADVNPCEIIVTLVAERG